MEEKKREVISVALTSGQYELLFAEYTKFLNNQPVYISLGAFVRYLLFTKCLKKVN